MASEAVVSFVVGKLGDLVIEEARLLYDVRDQFEWIVGELRRMQCFLKDADVKQKEDERVRNWVTEIRNVSFDAEDVIDTFILTQTTQTTRRTRRRFFLCVKRYICIVSELTTRHRVAKKIQHIKMKIGDISSSLQTYGIRDINEGGQETRLNIRRRSYALYEEPDLIGMQDSLTTLNEQLVSEEARRCVISIVGMGGSGKTTLAKKVYRDVKDNFDCHAFIYLSQQYGIRDVMIRIIECMMGLSREEKENSNEEDLRNKLHDHLREKRYLVVIDDIWTMQAWDELKLFLPDGSNKSRVLLTTHNKDVAVHADNVIDHYYIRLLNEDESWELFHKKIFTKGVVWLLELMEIGKKFLAKYRGLPLAIVVLGGLLSRREKTFSAWSNSYSFGGPDSKDREDISIRANMDTFEFFQPNIFQFQESERHSCSLIYNYSVHAYVHQFPPILHPYIMHVQDVKPDGNYGFRVIAVCLGFHEDAWATIRYNLIKSCTHSGHSVLQYLIVMTSGLVFTTH